MSNFAAVADGRASRRPTLGGASVNFDRHPGIVPDVDKVLSQIGAAIEPVLIVEDDAPLRDAICNILEEEGYTTLPAANGKEALHLLGLSRRPRLILLDLMMPVMTGWDLLRILRSNADLAGIPVVVVSAFHSPHTPEGFPSILKPIQVQTLLRLVDEYAA